jgi:geranylgeranyl diphosphate synthase, type II
MILHPTGCRGRTMSEFPPFAEKLKNPSVLQRAEMTNFHIQRHVIASCCPTPKPTVTSIQTSFSKSDSPELLSRWKDLSQRVDAKLNQCLNRLTNDCPARLREAMQYSLLSPGKRLRPILCLLATEALQADVDLAFPGAAALEMIHSYSLIHDDLPAMDDDDLRRGRPTCHIQFDEATAILAGDALQTLAFETLLLDIPNPSIAAKSCLILAKAAGPEGMVAGQSDDLQAENMGGDSVFLRSIHARKTGAVIRAAVVLGGLAAEAGADELDLLANYGDCIGIAFQIVDDLLDVEGSTENTGKRTGKDLERGKLTFPAIYGVDESRKQALGYVEQAIAIVDTLGPSAKSLQQLARYITDRSY